jgi:hypothetical protein
MSMKDIKKNIYEILQSDISSDSSPGKDGINGRIFIEHSIQKLMLLPKKSNEVMDRSFTHQTASCFCAHGFEL